MPVICSDALYCYFLEAQKFKILNQSAFFTVPKNIIAMILLIVLSVLPLITATGWPWNGRYDYRRNKIERRDVLPCLAEAPTNIWSTCASFLDEYQVNLPHLVTMNPELQNDCVAFKPGTTYCLLRGNPKSEESCFCINRNRCSISKEYKWCLQHERGIWDLCWIRIWRLLWKDRTVSSPTM